MGIIHFGNDGVVLVPVALHVCNYDGVGCVHGASARGGAKVCIVDYFTQRNGVELRLFCSVVFVLSLS